MTGHADNPSETIRAEARELMVLADWIADNFCGTVLSLLRECEGCIYFSGAGKNKPIAKKIVATFQSLGIRSHYISPFTWAHGDIGVLTDRDVLCALSKSGNTKELVALCKEAQSRGVKTVSIICNQGSALSECCNCTQLIPVEDQTIAGCLVPTASTTAFLAFGDALALMISEEEGRNERFLSNHPGGESKNNLS